AKGLTDLVGLLSLDQPERNLGGRFRGDHGLGALSGIAPDNAVDVAGRTRRNLLDQQAVLLAGGKRKPDRFEERIRREIKLLPLRQDIRRQILHAVIEAGDRDVAVLIEQAAENAGQHADRVLRAAAEYAGMQIAIGGL